MATIPMGKNTRKGGLAAGATARGLVGGPSQRTGKGYTKKTGYTRGGTTSQNKNDEDEDKFTWPGGETVSIVPKPLVQVPGAKPEGEGAGATNAETGKDKKAEGGDKDDDKKKEDGAGDKKKEDKKAKEEKKDPVAESQQSGMTSSLLETSEDEEAKRKEAEHAAKQTKKGLTEGELNADVTVTLAESETETLLLIPGVYVGGDKEEEFAATEKANKAYMALQDKKISSDTYVERGSQTLNLAQKTREITFQGYQQQTKELQATNWEIISASQQKRISEAERQKNEYIRFVDNIMTECLKDPKALIDAEALASHVSARSDGAGGAVAQQKSGTNSSKSGAKDSKKMKSSQSNLNQSVGRSQTSDKLSGTSMSQTGTGTQAISSETVAGDFAQLAKRVEYVETELPDTMMKAIRIIERLLTQTEYHEQHVLYKNYPPAKVVKASSEDEEDEENKKKSALISKKKEEAKKKEEEEAKKGGGSGDAAGEDLDPKDDKVTFKSLFFFECDVTEGRQVSCMDINELNPDLIAVGYGEYDINCVDDSKLKPGLLCFWTLKNPDFPEKIITHEHSITACQFSKKNPNLIAIGDSHGNIAIFNIRGSDTKPIAESKDMDSKHTDIVWEIQWMQRENKSESLISISGDGRIIEWSMKKGLEFNELMQLKRETNPNQKDVYAGAEIDKKAGGMTFINTGGLSIDFPASVESNVQYFVATEDCSIHQCSMSYSEQYLETYYGHTGPIYRVRCSPFWNKDECPIFLTCSYDWTVRVWHAKDKQKHVCHSIESLKEQVNDICWSPHTSSVFASVANDGRVEVWDLKRDNLQPLLTHFDLDHEGIPIKTPKTIVRFAKNSPVVLAGTLDGKVGVYRTFNLEHVQVSEKDQIHRLLSAITKDEFGEQSAKGKKTEEEA